MLTTKNLPSEIVDDGKHSSIGGLFQGMDLLKPFAEVRNRAIEEAELTYLYELLARYEGRLKPAAEFAGISTRHLQKLMNKYGTRKEEFEPSSRVSNAS